MVLVFDRFYCGKKRKFSEEYVKIKSNYSTSVSTTLNSFNFIKVIKVIFIYVIKKRKKVYAFLLVFWFTALEFVNQVLHVGCVNVLPERLFPCVCNVGYKFHQDVVFFVP